MDYTNLGQPAEAPQINGASHTGDKYIKWDAPGVEIIQPGEEDMKTKTAGHFCALQTLNFEGTHHCMRATHLKTQGCVTGKFTIKPNLPSHLAQSMFATPGSRDCIIRYSSLPFVVASDVPHAPRGLGLKVFDVEGEKLFGNASTQDFTFNNYSTLELRDMPGSEKLGDSLVRNFHDLNKFLEEQAARPDKEVASAPARIPPQSHMVAMTQWSQGAYRFGDYVAKFALFPATEEQKALVPVLIHGDEPANILSTNLQAYHKEKTVKYSFSVQLLQNLTEQPVEDTGIEWNETKYPFEEVAVIEIPPQESFDNSFRTWFDDSGVAANPWHGLKTLQPLGGANRVRRTVYAESRKKRLRMNGLKDYKEPETLSDVPIGVTGAA